MRHGRYKNARKHLQYLTLNNLLSTPLPILFCPTYIFTGLKDNVPILDRISGLLSVKEIRWEVTREAVEELKKINEQYGKWCEENLTVLPVHSDNNGSVHASIKRHCQRNKYTFVASNDSDLSTELRGFNNVSTVRLDRTVTLLEGLSNGVIRGVEKVERGKRVNNNEEVREIVKELKEKKGGREEGRGRKRRKAKEPNPLSVKKNGGKKEEGKTKKVRRKKQNVKA
ncbi:hypothetical protein TrLO_g4228 [Triparma laevis f. longispina]|uniref:UTP23 sensor motif region domain-containing protein n=1 Tax=Triparma laevis f. longispina TaxID=1714387 RepID=A0A9W7ED77_9STRA|nr:hypothetical protein TrLO_g4228 [Triparma laevis f. longispina]